ncbi:MAG: hypothetical protein V1646_03810 [bacterium]
MKKFIKANQTHIKRNSTTCEVIEYLFYQPNLGIAHAKINGRYPDEQNKKAINNVCDIIYFVLDGSGLVHTENGDFNLEKHDALFLTYGEWYWVEGNSLEILVLSAPEWTVGQYKEI